MGRTVASCTVATGGFVLCVVGAAGRLHVMCRSRHGRGSLGCHAGCGNGKRRRGIKQHRQAQQHGNARALAPHPIADSYCLAMSHKTGKNLMQPRRGKYTDTTTTSSLPK
jgi:hypothetical protein